VSVTAAPGLAPAQGCWARRVGRASYQQRSSYRQWSSSPPLTGDLADELAALPHRRSDRRAASQLRARRRADSDQRLRQPHLGRSRAAGPLVAVQPPRVTRHDVPLPGRLSVERRSGVARRRPGAKWRRPS